MRRKCKKKGVRAHDDAKPDWLTGGGIFPAKLSQTFSRDPARTALAEGCFCWLGAVALSGEAFSLVKTPIEHKRDYAHRLAVSGDPFSARDRGALLALWFVLGWVCGNTGGVMRLRAQLWRLAIAMALLGSVSAITAQPEQDVAAVRQAAEQGDAKAQAILGAMYEYGEGVTKDAKQAVAWYRQAAKQGQTAAQFKLGAMYHTGQGVAQNYMQAVVWYRQAAEQGDAVAQAILGAMYEHGEGVTQNAKQAVAWYHKAAEQGQAGAQSNLGVMYANGKGVAQDAKQAVAWMRKAAEQGESTAQSYLGLMYAKGKGVPQDYQHAYVWYSVAAANGEHLAIERRDAVAKNLTQADLSAAQKLATSYFEQYQPKS